MTLKLNSGRKVGWAYSGIESQVAQTAKCNSNVEEIARLKRL